VRLQKRGDGFRRAVRFDCGCARSREKKRAPTAR